MSIYVILPFLGFLINVVAISWVAAKSLSDRTNRAFISFCAVLASWQFIDVLYCIEQLQHEQLFVLSKLINVLWIFGGVLFLNFTHALTRTKRNKLFWSICIYNIAILTSDLLYNTITSEQEQVYWGVIPSLGPWYIPTLMISFALPATTSLYLLFINRPSEQVVLRRQINLLIVAIALTFASASFIGPIQLLYLDSVIVPASAAGPCSLLTFLVLFNIKKYRLMSTELIDSAQDIFAGVTDAVLITDIHGSINDVNKAFETLFQTSKSKCKSRRVNNFIPNLDQDKTFESQEQTITIGPTEKNILVSQTEVKQGSIITGRIIIIRDISELLNLKQQLNHSQKLDSLGRLAGGVAHDFNNMLGGILGSAEVLKGLYDNDSQAKTFLDIIQQSSVRASNLIDKLLSFSRKSGDSMQAVSVNTIIADTLHIVAHTRDKRIDIDTELDTTEHMILCNESQLQNAILNICLNGCEAMDNQGVLKVQTKLVTQDQQFTCPSTSNVLMPAQYIRIDITDHGQGIDNDIKMKVFDPFFTTKFDGNGLGLAATYGTIKDHNGSITFITEKGKGTTFTLLLPVTSETQVTEMDRAENTVAPPNTTILIADDEEAIRITTGEMLKQIGYNVIEANNGQEALNKFETHHDEIDLVILDMIMPKIRGDECFKQIIEVDPTQKVIIASGHTKDIEVQHLKEIGLSSFIQKPYKFDELKTAIKSELR